MNVAPDRSASAASGDGARTFLQATARIPPPLFRRGARGGNAAAHAAVRLDRPRGFPRGRRRAVTSAARYRIRTPQVACQTIEGESVLIHFETGCYYDCGGTGAAILGLLEQRLPTSDVVRWISRATATSETDATVLVSRFLEELLGEDLIVEDADAAPAGPAEAPLSQGLLTTAVVLKKFTDLQDLLLLDPIHDAGEAGWPAPPGPGE